MVFKFSDFLLANGFHQSKADYSLFTRQQGTVFIALLVYVDDIILASNDVSSVHEFKNLIDALFKIKDLGPLKFFLGLEVARSAKGISLCQRKFTLDVLTDSGFLGARPAKTPLEQHHKLDSSTGELLTDATSYRRLIGRLIYLAMTRLDLAYSVQVLSQFMDKPQEPHLQAAYRILRYLKATVGLRLFSSAASPVHLKAYSNSDWVACLESRKSITGYCVFIGDSLVS